MLLLFHVVALLAALVVKAAFILDVHQVLG
jgi:hypothetical protein